MTRRICVWSGPRNISTALMYSFRQRPDTTVVDEPLYGHYLATTGIWHPGREETVAAMSTDGPAVIRDVIFGPSPTPVIFFKQMAHHLVGLDWSFLDGVTNVILTRDPRLVLASFTKNVAEVDADTTGLPMCVRLLDRILDTGDRPIVIDSRELLLDPPSVLGQLCSAVNIPPDDRMLSWPAGPKPEDGVWAEHWYATAHRSTGFTPYQERTVELAEPVAAVAAECRPLYERLLEHAITAEAPAP